MTVESELQQAKSDMTGRRVLMVAIRYLPLMGGIETHIYEVARRLVEQGVLVTVLTANPKGQLPAEEIQAGIVIKRVNIWPGHLDFGITPEIFKIIKEGHWDVVHCQGYHTFFTPAAMLAAIRARVPYVVSFHSGGHSSRLRNAIRGIQRQTLRPLLAKANRLVAVSQFEADFFQDKLNLKPGKFVVVPNGASLPELLEKSTGNIDQKTIVSIGRLERYKGHHRVIEAFPEVLRKYPDAHLQIVGSGPYESELRRMVKTLGVSDSVEIGAVPPSNRAGMAAVLSKASVVTLLSNYEAHPIAVMEALAMKRPVLVTDTSGLGEIARKGWVKSVSLNSTATQVSQALIEQLEHPLIAIGVELPTWENCVMALSKLYFSVIQEKEHAKH